MSSAGVTKLSGKFVAEATVRYRRALGKGLFIATLVAIPVVTHLLKRARYDVTDLAVASFVFYVIMAHVLRSAVISGTILGAFFGWIVGLMQDGQINGRPPAPRVMLIIIISSAIIGAFMGWAVSLRSPSATTTEKRPPD